MVDRAPGPAQTRREATGRPVAPEIRARLLRLENRDKARVLRGFFKTGPGEYGEGDVFRGVPVPALRKLAAEYQDLSLTETRRLLHSAVHEERLLALLILVRAYGRGERRARRGIYDFYLKNTRFINNWDLVDASAEHIVGAYLLGKSRRPLYRLAGSGNLWERRIAVLSTFHFIKRGEFSETLKIARLLLGDREDLIHKAVGWMLREIGKRSPAAEDEFLKTHYRAMPRTMLRYALERFPQSKRRRYLNGKV